MTTNIQTTRLDGGHAVLARTDRHGHFEAVRFATFTQANRRAAELQAAGVTCWVLDRGVSRYVVIQGE
jgi:hypothetical protein